MKSGTIETVRSGRAAILVFDGYEDATEAWFRPDYWGAKAVPVGVGGRGSAWFIQHGERQLVLRHYRRGGMMARLSQRSYIYTGWRNARSFREFRLLAELYNRGLPVPGPVAAWAEKQGLLLHHAAILIERIPDAVPLLEAPKAHDESLWEQVGKTIRRFHDHGLDHVDLNCDNILIARGVAYLIDFDRCRLRHTNSLHGRWKNANLKRLFRSLEKRATHLSDRQKELFWGALLSGYGRIE